MVFCHLYNQVERSDAQYRILEDKCSELLIENEQLKTELSLRKAQVDNLTNRIENVIDCEVSKSNHNSPQHTLNLKIKPIGEFDIDDEGCFIFLNRRNNFTNI